MTGERLQEIIESVYPERDDDANARIKSVVETFSDDEVTQLNSQLQETTEKLNRVTSEYNKRFIEGNKPPKETHEEQVKLPKMLW